MDLDTILINWYGPVTVEQLDEYHKGGLYMVTGYQRYQRLDQIQYIGITSSSYSTRFSNHHKINEVTRNRRIWLGKIIHPQVPSRTILERAESILIYAQQPLLNQRKKISVPRPIVIISHWFKADQKPRYNRQGIFTEFKDVVSWDGKQWREGNLRVLDN